MSNDAGVCWWECDGGKGLFMLVVGGSAVGAQVLLVIAIFGWVGMEVVHGEHVGHSQEVFATQRDMSEYFLCVMWEHCWHMMGRMLCQIFMWQSRHQRSNTLVLVTVAVDGRAAAPPELKKQTVLNTPMRSGEVAAGSVEVSLAGRADDECGVTAYWLRAAGACGSRIEFDVPCTKEQ